MKYTALAPLFWSVALATSASTLNSQVEKQGLVSRRGINPTLISGKCVFILASGQSGSTALMDALNQIPHYLIRGEQWAAFWNIYEAFLNFEWTMTEPVCQRVFNWTTYNFAELGLVKELYDMEAPRQKLPWFNEFPQERLLAAIRSYYNVLYGYYGRNLVSGFKDSRCVSSFNGFMAFLRTLCLDVKVLLNTRLPSSFGTSMKIHGMEQSLPEDDFRKDLMETYALFDSYVTRNTDHAFRVFYEDMHDPAVSKSLASVIEDQ
uniref:MTF0992 n=1 Tax=Volvox carteri f. nagariensis TaxID=3068 RepID=D9CIZ0_VOLCA|nr:MTF0992 [Volvox carteri f. nagariensis]